ncbi:ferric reductase like transmembrane component-domain-containing protein [Dipodascopsis tothii]|uniref:ferric reductase like transmembrane component-domain-containing protein n=1 Tax=Dipodascopsis tothii TaxID=44089 RepID=UPI0034CE7CFD
MAAETNTTLTAAQIAAALAKTRAKNGRAFSRKFYLTYNIIVVGLFLLACAAYWVNIHLVQKPRSNEKRPLIGQGRAKPGRYSAITNLYRKARGVLLYQPPGRYLESYGTMLVIGLYLGLNAFYCFYDSTFNRRVLANRFGLMSVVNMPILFLLGSKTGLLVQWTGWSHEGYIILHRHAGRVVCLTALGHVVAFCSSRSLASYLEKTRFILGFVSLLAFLIILVTSISPIRNRMYETFLYAHVYFLVVGMVVLYFHYARCRPYIITSGVIFIWDRVVRFKDSHHVVGRTENVSGETVKLSLDVNSTFRDIHWKTGQYIYVTISELARTQAHPFTIASHPSASTLDLIIRARRGFSRSLYDSEKTEHKVTFHGPYGSPATFENCQKVILLAGGAGVSYTYPEAIELAKGDKFFDGETPEIDFLWVVPKRDFADWVDLDSAKYGVDFKLWVTAESGRPDIKQYVKDSVLETLKQNNYDPDTKVAVAVCGPAPLVLASRNACADLLWDNVNVMFYSESFGW